ncbi:MAG: SGNH/GDSL hydrolase family protein, partial [Acidobacteriaceae bacterium]|nr:SGNH/GDSL hydrolase family protein [Acidobacteriaceae bacterium]
MRTSSSALLLIALIPLSLCAGAQQSHWVATWGASPSPQMPDEASMRKEKLVFDNQTLREIVHTSVSGDVVRMRLSNAYGKTAADIGAAHLALRAQASDVVPASDRALTFSGRPSVSIPPNAIVLSDPVKLNVPAGSDLAISIFLPHAAEGAGIHYAAQQTSYIASGDASASRSTAEATTITSWIFLEGVDVLAPGPAATLVAFGDSITDGAHSSIDANRRWPNILADRLLARHNASEIGVIDAGIGGNRILHDAVTNVRFGVN